MWWEKKCLRCWETRGVYKGDLIKNRLLMGLLFWIGGFFFFCLMHSFFLLTRPDLGLPSLPRHLIVEIKYRAPSLHRAHLSVLPPSCLHLSTSPSGLLPLHPFLSPPSSSHSGLNKTDEKNNRFFIAPILYLISNLLDPASPPAPCSAQFNCVCDSKCAFMRVCVCVCVCVQLQSDKPIASLSHPVLLPHNGPHRP